MSENSPTTPAELDAETLAFAHRVFEMARSGDAARLAELVDAGLPPDTTDAKGDTLLVLAAYHGHPEAVQVLLARGADHARTNDRGQTALSAAVFRQSEDGVRALVAAGADPDHGSPSARATAEFFELPAMAVLLQP